MTDAAVFAWLHSFAGRAAWLDGSIIFTAIYLPWLMAAGALAYLIVSNGLNRQLLVRLIEAACALALGRLVITAGIRALVARPRPFTLPGAHSLFITGGTSFPSAHATYLFAASMMLYAYNKKAGILLAVLSVLVCLARIMAGVHYPSDILAGAATGVVAGLIVLGVARRLRH